jgi:hypothetical protein
MTKSLLIASCLTLTAVLAPVAIAANSGSGNRMEQAFKKADKDSDGTLDREEAKALPRVAKNFDQIDTNKDGKVSLDEIYTSARKIAGEMEEHNKARFAAADKDHDGTLDRDEAKALPRVSQNFDKIDANKDGKVSADEIKSYAKAQRAANANAPKN